MKIYTKIRIDLKTGKTIAEESFEYAGPLALCWDGDGADEGGGGDEGGFGGDSASGDFGEESGFEGGYNSSDDFGGWDTSSVDAATAAAAAGDPAGMGPGGMFSGLTPEDFDEMEAASLGFSLEQSSLEKAWNAIKQFGTYLNMGAKAVVGVLGLSNPAGWPVSAVAFTSLYKDLEKQGVTLDKIADAISKQTGVSTDKVSSVINDPSFQDAMDSAGSEEIGAALSANGLVDPASSAGGWTAVIQSEGWGGNMTDQLGNLLTASTPDMTAFNAAMDEFKTVNTNIKFLHDMSELEGVTLSDEEKQFLETMRLNATTNLTNTVNEATLNLAETEIARMVNKGVLQGNIGSETMSKIYEASGKIVGEQSRNIESDVAKMGLGVLEQKKTNQMGLWGQELTADIASATAGTDKWKSIGMLELGKAEQGQKWNQSLLDSITTMRGQDIGLEGQKLGAATNLNLASQEMSAWKSAQEKQMWSNIASSLISAWA